MVAYRGLSESLNQGEEFDRFVDTSDAKLLYIIV